MKRFHTKLDKRALEGNPLPLVTVVALVVLGTVHETKSFVLDDTAPPTPLRVASFNIKWFGRTKMSRPEVVENLVKIFQRYDLVFVMETRDSSTESLKQLRSVLGDTQWNYTASEPIGRTTYKEQYVYWYRPAAVKLLNAYVYDDTRDDFEREPYMAQFQYWSQGVGSEVKVTFVGIHVKPDLVVEEMEDLPDAITSAKQIFPDSNGIVAMGDFNADCTYMNDAERSAALLLNTPSQYTSFVGDDVDTTVSHNTDCSYDRLVVPAKDQEEIKVANVDVFDFEKGLGLSFDDAYAVSDHYPVEFTLE